MQKVYASCMVNGFCDSFPLREILVGYETDPGPRMKLLTSLLCLGEQERENIDVDEAIAAVVLVLANYMASEPLREIDPDELRRKIERIHVYLEEWAENVIDELKGGV